MSLVLRLLFLGFISFSTFTYADPPSDPKKEEDTHEFFGRHLIASYSGCDQKALTDLDALVNTMLEAAKSSGATILQSVKHIFSPDGLTMVILLGESHASIHTYPEYGSCFVDLFTCGSHCSSEKFDRALQEYLKPSQVNSRILIRHQGIEDTE